MVKKRHEHSALIDAIGGERVAARFGLTHQNLHMWRVRGIPLVKRIAFAKFAAEHGAVPPEDFLKEVFTGEREDDPKPSDRPFPEASGGNQSEAEAA